MKYVALLTMHQVVNFGSALQTYATMKCIERNPGFRCTLIDYRYPDRYHLDNASLFVEQVGFRKKLKAVLRRCGLLSCCRKWRDFLRRKPDLAVSELKFRAFLSELEKTPEVDRKSVRGLPVFDIYMTGSDQTWNPRYISRDTNFFLAFAPPGARKISYASSWGNKSIPEAFHPVFAPVLNEYDAISVREASGREIVNTLTARTDAVHVADPTLLLDAEEWKEIVRNEYPAEKPFILCYILHYFNPYPFVSEVIERVRELTGFDVYVIGPPDASLNRPDYRFIPDAGPREFVELFSKASFIVTTSFHGTAFACNFRKNFYTVLNPHSTSDDRASSLLDAIGLRSRGVCEGKTQVGLIRPEELTVDYSEAAERLEALVRDSRAFLSAALTGTDLRKNRDA